MLKLSDQIQGKDRWTGGGGGQGNGRVVCGRRVPDLPYLNLLPALLWFFWVQTLRQK